MGFETVSPAIVLEGMLAAQIRSVVFSSPMFHSELPDVSGRRVQRVYLLRRSEVEISDQVGWVVGVCDLCSIRN
jgi:hypothetical protein